MDVTKYGDKFKDHLIEEYKLFVQMADNVSARRSQANQFYISVLSILLAAVALGRKWSVRGYHCGCRRWPIRF